MTIRENARSQHVLYVRVSTLEQNTARQLDGVTLDKMFEEKASGKDTKRPVLEQCLDYLREDDTLHVHSIDRLCRNLKDLLNIVSSLNKNGITVKFHKENLTFTGEDNPFQQLQLQIIGAVAMFERQMILERQREGIAIAKTQGKYKGRKAALTTIQIEEIKNRLANGETVAAIAREYGTSRQTVYKYIKN